MKKLYTKRSPNTLTEVYLDDISKILEEQINIQTISEETRISTIDVGPTPVLAVTESTPLKNRHGIKIINDSSFLVYIGFTQDLVVGENTILINSGSILSIATNPLKRKHIWIVSPDIETNIKIVEVS